MEQNNNNRREELEYALRILTGDNGRIYAACALSNSEATGHQSVVEALITVQQTEEPVYMIRDEWFYFMDEEERAEYENDYEKFCEACDSFNSNIVNKAIIDAKEELQFC